MPCPRRSPGPRCRTPASGEPHPQALLKGAARLLVTVGNRLYKPRRRALRLSVRTPPFHGGERGSIPLGRASFPYRMRSARDRLCLYRNDPQSIVPPPLLGHRRARPRLPHTSRERDHAATNWCEERLSSDKFRALSVPVRSLVGQAPRFVASTGPWRGPVRPAPPVALPARLGRVERTIPRISGSRCFDAKPRTITASKIKELGRGRHTPPIGVDS